MPAARTPNAALQKPATTDRDWDIPLNANADTLDAIQAIGAMAVAQSEYPSTSLNVKVSAGTFINQSGAYVTFSGIASFTLSPSATTLLWLSNTGTLTSGSSWPAAAHVRLASVVAGAATIMSITDKRTPYRSATS